MDISKYIDIEFQNIKRFAESIEGCLNIIRHHIDPKFEINEVGSTEYETETFTLVCILTTPLCFRIEIYVEDVRIAYVENAYGKISGTSQVGSLDKIGLWEFDKELANYLFNWRDNTWKTPYNPYDTSGRHYKSSEEVVK